ncbi:SOH1-domain-containing protein [Melampsora americana]|nr:SOH1-domain-containing protein [Melampsora americana]
MPPSDPTSTSLAEADEDQRLRDAKDANQARFEEDLEFVQSLANPHFVQELTLKGILASEPMVNYLNYLKYFHDPQYAVFIRYPNCLLILDLLNKSEKFRTMIESQESAQFLSDKLIQNWITLSGRLNKPTPGYKDGGQETTQLFDRLNAAAGNGKTGLDEMADGNAEGGSLNGNSP